MDAIVVATVLCFFGLGGEDQLGEVGQEEALGPEAVVVNEAPVVGRVKHTGHRPTATGHGWIVDWFGPMPQTCYQPRFGCYPGNPRTIHRYPAFHGYYYRNPYNYRHLFEYPWHAQPNEPRDFQTIAGDVSGEETRVDESAGVPLAPQPDPALRP